MGLFRFKRKKKKKGSQQQWSSPLVDNYVSSDSLNSYQAQADGNETTRTDPTPPQQPETIHPVYNTNECSMEQIPTLLHELAATVHTASDEAARVLRQLFALSEHCTAGGTLEETRQEMVADGTLVPALLLFLQRCRDELKLPSAAVPPQARNSSSSAVLQQPQLYLALLVLNNISIPAANKRLVALEYNGAAVLCSLLCDDPSCHLVAIVLVNLTFGDVSLRRELACADIDLLEALSFAFRVAALTEQEYETRKRLADASGRTPSERLSAIFAFDKQQHQPPVESTYWPPTQDQIYPDTVRWCLCAMQNLTRPGKDAINNFAAFRLIHTGIVPYILRCLKISEATVDTSFASAATNDTPVPSDPADCIGNHPSSWGSQSAQDAALFVVMNLATDPSARKFLLQTDTVTVLAAIARCGAAVDGKRWKADRQLIRLQGVKARMALAYLVGSSGHFGQKCRRMGQSVDDVVCQNENVLLVSKIETEQLMETLANTLHRRSKAGSGGYSAVTFNLKYVLLGIRCLLTQPKNQEMFAETNMELLNALFIKVIALFALRNVTFIDTEAAEYACMSLYHLSHYGFHACFLPYTLGRDYNVRSLVAKVLIALKDRFDITPATQHAASQLLLRIKYLVFVDTDAAQAGPKGYRRMTADCCLDSALVTAAKHVVVAERVRSGVPPRADIFNRGVIRSKSGGASDDFPSALHAVQELSFGSTKVRHVDAIDDILIANNIANCADGNKADSYGYVWKWREAENEKQATTNSAGKLPSRSCHSLSVLAMALGLSNICGSDTTTTT